MNTKATSRTKGLNSVITDAACWRGNKVVLVKLSDLATVRTGSLPTYAEQKAERPNDYSVYEIATGQLLFSASAEPIYERCIKVVVPDGLSFYTRNTMMTIGGSTFPFSDVILHWIGETGATIELIEQDAAWESGTFDRIQGFAPGTMLVVEDCKWNGQRVLMASEFKFGIKHVLEYHGWLSNSYWKVADWAKLPMWGGHSDWGYLEAHKGMRTALATGKTSTIWIYITA